MRNQPGNNDTTKEFASKIDHLLSANIALRYIFFHWTNLNGNSVLWEVNNHSFFVSFVCKEFPVDTWMDSIKMRFVIWANFWDRNTDKVFTMKHDIFHKRLQVCLGTNVILFNKWKYKNLNHGHLLPCFYVELAVDGWSTSRLFVFLIRHNKYVWSC